MLISAGVHLVEDCYFALPDTCSACYASYNIDQYLTLSIVLLVSGSDGPTVFDSAPYLP